MSGFIIQKSKIGEWLDALGKSRAVLMPRYDAEKQLVSFEPRQVGSVPDWDHLTTTASPKDLFFPQSETLMAYGPSEAGLELKETLPGEEKRLLFGARTCDARALLLLDKVFSDDPYYMRRRANTAIVAVECREPRDGCFCEVLTPAGEPWDVLLTDLGDSFYAEAVTDQGKQMIETASLFTPAGEKETGEKQKVQESFRAKFPGKIDIEAVATKAAGMWDDPIWVELSRRCIGCGACSYLCPTCHCFDIQDDFAGGPGIRFRCWDTCQERDFTLMGHGHNPRPSRKERHRQRVLHKFLYIPTNFAMTGCVGCGRCVEKCPVNVDIREVLRTISG